MKYILPVAITDAMLVSHSVPETDHAAWNGATNYATGTRVIRTSTHRIYERLAPGGITATAPELDPANWVDALPTNRWAMFDRSVGTVTAASGSITVTITPGEKVEGLALLDLDCESVEITCTVLGSTVYSASFEPVLDDLEVTDWYSYFFASILRRQTLVITDIPPYDGMTITIAVGAAAGSVSCGTLAIGRVYQVGDTLAGVGLTFQDFSVKSTDAFGTTTITQRGCADRMTCRTLLAPGAVDSVYRRLKAIRATPVVWIGAQSIESTVLYGWGKDFAVDLALKDVHHCSFTVEALVAN